MQRGNHIGGLTQRARHGEPQPTPINTMSDEPISAKRDLKSWWKNFSRGNQKRDNDSSAAQMGIFGIPLTTSVRYANVAISLQDAEGNSYVYGYVPIVVAKCGVFLKEKATDVEGIFRLSGSEKRIKELKEQFNSPDRYGKGLDWTGYTVHDAANILRRYFNMLPEPIIPLEFYERFRDPLRNHESQAVGQIEGQTHTHSAGDFDHQATIRVYQNLITELPPLNRQLLLYILDLLAVFASKSDLNKMTTPNLSAIFQPGILSHPSHNLAPPEYQLSQNVLIFLIENQDHFLIGMPGTGADEKTKQDVESGPPTPSVQRPPKSVIGRSSSGASRYSNGVRRSVSVSSKQSATVSPSPITPNPQTPSSIGVHRSNTLPSKHSPRASHSRFQRENSETSSPSATPTPMYTPAEMPGAFPQFGEPSAAESTRSGFPLVAPAPPDIVSPSSDGDTPPAFSSQAGAHDFTTQPGPSDTRSPRPDQIDIPPQARTMSLPPGQTTPGGSTTRGLAAIFTGNKPTTPEIVRKPNKLQKKRLPNSSNPSAQSSQHSLDGGINYEQQMPMVPLPATSSPLALAAQTTPTQTQTTTFLQAPGSEAKPGLKPEPPMSPANSYRSHSEFTEGELDDVQPLDHAGPSVDRDLGDSDAPDTGGKRRRFWRRKGESISYGTGGSHSPSPNVEAQRSRSSILSGGDRDRERKSLTLDRNVTLSDEDNQRDSNPLLWIKGKLAERAEKKEEKDRLKEERKRAKSPEGLGHYRGVSHSIQSLSAATSAAGAASGNAESGFGEGNGMKSPPMAEPGVRMGKSMDIRREGRTMDTPSETQTSTAKQGSETPRSARSARSASNAAATAAYVPTSPAVPSPIETLAKPKPSMLEMGEEAETSDAQRAALLAASNAGGV